MPAVGTRCRADQALGWDPDDPDLRYDLTGTETVELCMIGTQDFPNLDADDELAEYMDLYRHGGPAALPPLWAWEGGRFPTLITGTHRSTAAHRVGLPELPAWVVVDPE